MKYPQLFIPGPVDVAPEVLEAMSAPMIGHRSAAFSQLYEEVTSGIAEFLYTQHHVYLATCSATGLWEAAVRNIAPKRALCCVNGAFSQRWFTTVRACGFEADLLEVDWGKGIHPEMIRERLSSGKYDLLTLVHNETSTGVASPLEEIGRLMQDEFPDVYFAVDAVSSMVGMPIRFDDWGIDILLASVQKAWALPPGFSICIVHNRVLKRSSSVTQKGYYFDFIAWEKKDTKGQTIVTPSIPHMYGLKKQIERIRSEGLASRFDRYRAMAKATRAWAQTMGLTMFSEAGFHSDTVSCIRNDVGWDLEHLGRDLMDRGYQFSNGYGRLKNQTFRIPHMGETTPEILSAYLKLISDLAIKK